jgi:hypothetical protein
MSYRLLQIAAALVCLFMGAWQCSAQSTTAQITGVVRDATGGSIANARITVTNVDTGIERTAETNEFGYYTVGLLQPGNYEIASEKAGFQRITRTGITLTLNQVARADLVLQVGDLSQSIRVEEDVTLVQTDRPESSTVVTTMQFDRLPLVQNNRMRNPVGFVYMTPRVQGNYVPDGSDNVGATTQVRFGGGQQFESEVTVEGIAGGRTQTTGSITEAAPPVDAVREFKVTNSLMSAEWGHTGIGVVNLQLKSGTNEFHGTVFEYLRNDKLDARSWLARSRTVTRQNEFGFTAGGPVWLPKLYNGKDRTFFFVSYAGSRKRGATDTEAVQIATQENMAGDFSNLRDNRGNARLIYDPATTRPDPQAGFVRTPFPGNQIPRERMDPVALKIAAFLPAPNAPGTLNYRGPIGEFVLDPDTFVLKLDHALTDKHRMAGSINTTDIPRLLVRSPLPFPLPDTASDQVIKGYTVRLTYDYVMRPTLMNQLSLGYNLFDHNNLTATQRVYPSATGSWPGELGLKGVIGTAFPVIRFTGGYAGFAATTGTSDDEQMYVLKDAVSWFKGKHSLKFGVELRAFRSNLRGTGNQSGTFNFSELGTALPGQQTTTGNAIASFLLGDVQSGSLNFPSVRAPRRPYTGLYIQDDLKLTSRLTLNLGFRFEFIKAAIDALDRASTIDLTLPNPGAGGLPGAMIFAGEGQGRTGRRSFVDTDYSGFGPRFGIAYQVTPGTVLRAGYGIYYANNYLELSNAGFNITGSFQSLDNGVTPAFHLRDGFPQNFRQESSIDPTFLNRQSGSTIEQSAAAMPRTQNWSFSVQRQIARDLQAEASYIGTRATRLIATQLVRVNQVHPSYLSLGPLLTRNITSPEARAANIPLPYPGFTGTVAQALRPYPQYLDLTATSSKAGSSKYHAMMLRLQKRFSGGLVVDGHYTWSKAMGYASYATGTVDVLGQDNYNRRLEHSILLTDVPHAFAANFSYELPFGPGKRWVNARGAAGTLLGGWSISAIFRYQSGFPLPLSMTNTIALFNQRLRPDVVSGQQRETPISNGDFNPYADRHINLAAFAAPAPFRFGTAAPTYTDMRTFPVLNEDVSLVKDTRISERVRLETYGQFFNVLNRHRFHTFDSNFSSASFGRAGGVSLPRFIQLGVRVRF